LQLEARFEKGSWTSSGAFFNGEMSVAARSYDVRDLFHKKP
jgi:hypothetical protein